MSTKSIQKTLRYQRFTLQDNLEYFKANHTKKQQTFAEDIAISLKNEFKSINPKYFYDDTGSKLFDKICQLPEYYPYNCEYSILKNIEKNTEKRGRNMEIPREPLPPAVPPRPPPRSVRRNSSGAARS